MWRRYGPTAALVMAALLTVAVRVPVLVAKVPATDDEGVYGASVMAMRAGAAPFRDIFSSQGPLFLPILWLFDLLGLGEVRAIRVAMLAAAVAIALGTYALTCRVASRGVAIVGAAVAGTAAAVWLAAGPVQSDGIALALALWGVVMAMGWGPLQRARPVAVGLLLGAAIAVKSLFVVPAGVTVVWLYLSRREGPGLAIATGVGLAVLFATSVPWGLGNVWDQYVQFQLDAPRRRDPLHNLVRLRQTIWKREAMLLGFAGAAVVGRAVRRRPAAPNHGAEHAERVAVLVWLVGSVLLLVFGTEFGVGFERFLAFSVPPAIAALAMLRPPLVLAVLGVVAALPLQLASNEFMISPQRQTSIHREVEARINALPAHCLIVSDRQGLVWLAGRRTPPGLVDTSWARIRAGSITEDDIVDAAHHPETCAVLFYSGHFDWMDPQLAERFDGYMLAEDWGGGRRLYVRAQ